MVRLARPDHKVEIRAAILARARVSGSQGLAARKDKDGATNAIRAATNWPQAPSPTR